ncbi:ArsR/SmtB family transcription factor [Halalkalicoccus jeotgali]|uniref:ArsR/SmtB family transcription factor n=1 Tax=Halalkalicoccus jeotgali TaxID=413810 RepID=UPI0006779670
MENDLWYLIGSVRGGENRIRIIRLLEERPHNANQLAGRLGLSYNTVRYHLDRLCEHGIVEAGGQRYGELYHLTERFERHREAFEAVTERAG